MARTFKDLKEHHHRKNFIKRMELKYNQKRQLHDEHMQYFDSQDKRGRPFQRVRLA